jgi:hypothetical protein
MASVLALPRLGFDWIGKPQTMLVSKAAAVYPKPVQYRRGQTVNFTLAGIPVGIFQLLRQQTKHVFELQRGACVVKVNQSRQWQ